MSRWAVIVAVAAALVALAWLALDAWVDDRAAVKIAARMEQVIAENQKHADAALKKQAATEQDIAHARTELEKRLEACAALSGPERIDCCLRLLREDAAARGDRAAPRAHGPLPGAGG